MPKCICISGIFFKNGKKKKYCVPNRTVDIKNGTVFRFTIEKREVDFVPKKVYDARNGAKYAAKCRNERFKIAFLTYKWNATKEKGTER